VQGEAEPQQAGQPPAAVPPQCARWPEDQREGEQTRNQGSEHAPDVDARYRLANLSIATLSSP
jgi:hypothetical protein